MPEGPELFLASLFITNVSKSRRYGGSVVKSEVSTKNPDVSWDCEVYRISAVARGKELKVTLTEGDEDTKDGRTMDILFRFGMSGSFKFTSTSEIPKHAHLRFYTIREDEPMVLSFVDYRRFGRWEVGANWSRNRGPDPMWEYQCFRDNVLANLKKSAFNKPICEVMLNQKFFNGIGNYLRAEILYRCQVPPFDEAREVLSDLKPFSHWYDAKFNHIKNTKVKIENGVLPEKQQNVAFEPDFLDLCHIVPKEVINLEGGGKGYNVDPDADVEDYAAFKAWLQCYYKDGMQNLVDGNSRTIWFCGAPGKLLPKDPSSRSRVERKRKADQNKKATKATKSKEKLHDKARNEDVVPDMEEEETEHKVKREGAAQKAKKCEAKSKGRKSKAIPKAIKNNGIQEESKLSKRRKTKELSAVPLRRSNRSSSQDN